MTSGPALLAALDLVNKVVERRGSIPILSHALLRGSGGKMLVTGTDLDIQVDVALLLDAGKFAACVPAGTLHNVLRHAEPVFETGPGEIVVGKDPRFTLPTLPVDDFPTITSPKLDVALELPARRFADDLHAVQPAISTEETRFYLNGVYFHLIGGDLAMAATDGHRLHQIRREMPAGASALDGSILPRKAVGLILDAIDAFPDTATVKAEFGGSKARFAIGPVTITAKLIDHSFPDYARVFPADWQGTWEVEAAGLEALLDAAEAVGGSHPMIVLDFGGGKAGVQGSTDGELHAGLQGKRDGELPNKIGTHTRYLRAVCQARPDATLKLCFGDAASPILISADDDSFLAVVMPMRVK